MTPSPPAPIDEKPDTTVALLAGLPPFVGFGLALALAPLVSGTDFMWMIARAGAFGWGTVFAGLLAAFAVALGAFLTGRVARLPAPIVAAFAMLPSLVGAAGVSFGAAQVLEAVASVNPADKMTILFAGWSEVSQGAVIGFLLAAGGCGAAALSLGLAAMARRGQGDRGHRADLLASAAVLLGGSAVLLLQGLLLAHLSRGYEAAANVNPADRATIVAAIAGDVARDEGLLLGGWVFAAALAIAAIALTRIKTQRLSGLVSVALILGGAWAAAKSVEAAQQRSDTAASVPLAPQKLLRVEGRAAFSEGALLISGNEIVLQGDADPPELVARLVNLRKEYDALHAYAQEPTELVMSVNLAASATPGALARLLPSLKAAGISRFKLVGTPVRDHSQLQLLPARMQPVMQSVSSGSAGITVDLLDTCADCTAAAIDGDDLVLTSARGATRAPLKWSQLEDTTTGRAVFAPPAGDLQRWVLALSTASGQQLAPAVVLP